MSCLQWLLILYLLLIKVAGATGAYPSSHPGVPQGTPLQAYENMQTPQKERRPGSDQAPSFYVAVAAPLCG